MTTRLGSFVLIHRVKMELRVKPGVVDGSVMDSCWPLGKDRLLRALPE